jgi:DMSO/TMAO reductase YedYZ molybdopterin-dependent catalytic subunit
MARVVTDGHAGYNGKGPWQAVARRDRADQGRAAREQRHPELPLDDLAFPTKLKPFVAHHVEEAWREITIGNSCRNRAPE